MSRPRRVLAVLLGTVLSFLIAAAVIWFGWAPRHLAPMVASRLSTAYGGLVQVAAVEVGAAGSSLHGLQLYEAGANPGDAPWATVGKADADVTLGGLAAGRTAPRHLRLRGADVSLHFDRGGHLVTRLPHAQGKQEALPRIEVEASRIAIRQEGRPEMVLSGLALSLWQEDGEVVVTGMISDPQWGNWSVQGQVNPGTGVGSANLKTAGTHVTQAMLDELPFVSAKTWREVRLEGDTPCDFALHLGQTAEDFHYRVALEPQNTRVEIPSIRLVAERARGRVVVEDKVVRLDGVAGQAAGGEIRVPAAELDFRTHTSKLSFRVGVDKLDMRKLPRSWSLPLRVTGKLTGKAELVLSIANGHVQTSGSGEGVVEDVTIAGLRALPIHLRLHAAGGGFHFGLSGGTSAGGVPVFLASRPVEHVETQDRRFWPGWLVDQSVSFLSHVVTTVAEAGQKVVSRLTHALQAPAATTPGDRALDVKLAMTDVDLAKLLKGLGIPVPFSVSGRITFQVTASIPVDTSGDAKTYRLDGTARLSQVSLAGLELEKVEARVAYRNGILTLNELTGRLPGGPVVDARSGTLHGTASLRVVPEGDLTARLTVTAIPLARLLTMVPGGAGMAGGAISGEIQVRASSAKLKDPAAWHAIGTLRADRLEAYGRAATDVSTMVRLESGTLEVSSFKGRLDGAPITGDAVVPLKGKATGGVDIQFKDVEVAALSHAVPRMPVRLDGRAEGTIHGTLTPAVLGHERTLRVRLDLQSPRLRVEGIPAEKFMGTVNYDRGTVDYRLAGETLGGTFDVNGQLQAKAEGTPAKEWEPEGRLRIRGVRLGRLWQALQGPGGPSPLRGLLDVDVRYRTGPDWRPVGRGTVIVSRLRWGTEVLADRLMGDLDLTPAELRLRNLSAGLAGGTLRGRAALRYGRAGWFNVTLDGVELAQLLAPWPGVATRAQGPATIKARGSLGRMVSGSGQIFLLRGRLGGAEVMEGRVPFTFEIGTGGNGRLEVQDGTLQVAGGRVTGRGTYERGDETRLDARVDFTRVNLQALLREVGGTTRTPAGRVSGRFTLDGGNIRSVNDLTGLLDASLEQTQAFQLPVLQQVSPFVIPYGSSSLTFDSGSLRARLGRGSFRVERLGLEGKAVRLFAEGNVTLQGRLALDVTTTTGRLGLSPLVLERLGVRVPTGGPVPISLVREVSTFLSNRVIHLHVGGTVQSPSVQFQPLALLSQQAALFFLYRAAAPIP